MGIGNQAHGLQEGLFDALMRVGRSLSSGPLRVWASPRQSKAEKIAAWGQSARTGEAFYDLIMGLVPLRFNE